MARDYIGRANSYKMLVTGAPAGKPEGYSAKEVVPAGRKLAAETDRSLIVSYEPSNDTYHLQELNEVRMFRDKPLRSSADAFLVVDSADPNVLMVIRDDSLPTNKYARPFVCLGDEIVDLQQDPNTVFDRIFRLAAADGLVGESAPTTDEDRPVDREEAALVKALARGVDSLNTVAQVRGFRSRCLEALGEAKFARPELRDSLAKRLETYAEERIGCLERDRAVATNLSRKQEGRTYDPTNYTRANARCEGKWEDFWGTHGADHSARENFWGAGNWKRFWG